MANMCENTLTVSGSKKRLKQFMEFAEGSGDHEGSQELDFNKFVPYPEKYAEPDRVAREFEAKLQAMPEDQRRMFYALKGETPKDGYNNGGYEWCKSQWGTKWNASNISRDVCGNTLIYDFDTAWNPPLPVIEAMSKKFPDLQFELAFREEGMGYEGECSYVDGEGESETRVIEPDADEDEEKEGV